MRAWADKWEFMIRGIVTCNFKSAEKHKTEKVPDTLVFTACVGQQPGLPHSIMIHAHERMGHFVIKLIYHSKE